MIKNFNPLESWSFLQQNPSAVLIDVRTTLEHAFVGHPPDATLIAWKEFPDMNLNEKFVEQVGETVTDKNIPIMLLCRSGARSLAAAKALEKVGFQYLINIVEGYEGDLNEDKHRSKVNGWRFHGLPWLQS